MAFNGSGVFNRLFTWVTDKTNLVPVTSSRMDSEMDGFAAGLSNCITKDGQQTITATIPWNSQGLTGVGQLTVTGSTASTSSTTGAAIISGGLGVGGAVNAGGAIKSEATTASTSTTTGSLIAAGGVGIAGSTFANLFRATNQPCFSAHKNGTDQTGIAHQTFTKATFGTEAFDIGGFYDTTNSRWTPPVGMINVVGVAYMSALLTINTAAVVSIYKNGVRFKDANFNSGSLGSNSGNVSIIDRANGTDYYELFVFGSTATTFQVDGATNLSYFMGWTL